jgi:hypothetical protein
MWQWLLVAMLVLLSAVYAAWALLPAVTRQRLARRLASIPGPLARVGERLERAARPVTRTGADCDACPHSRVDSGVRKRPPAR